MASSPQAQEHNGSSVTYVCPFQLYIQEPGDLQVYGLSGATEAKAWPRILSTFWCLSAAIGTAHNDASDPCGSMSCWILYPIILKVVIPFPWGIVTQALGHGSLCRTGVFVTT